MQTKILKLRPAFIAYVAAALAYSSIALSQQLPNHWSFINNETAVPFGGCANPLLLTDGSIMVQDTGNRSNWWKLTPDNTGNYANGTWTQLASLPSGYGPTYYASAVLKSGKVIVEGGEYNVGVMGQAETNMGAIYDPETNTWTSVDPPAGWTEIGDTSGVVLPGGHYLLAALTGSQLAELDESTLSWTVYPGTGKQDSNNEEGWTLLPDHSILTIDVSNTGNPMHAERLLTNSKEWISAGDTPVLLADLTDSEIGPAVLRPDGSVFATGATDKTGTMTGHTAIYTPPTKERETGTWVAGPDFPNHESIADGPAALLINGNVLVQAGPGYTNPGSVFYEFDGTNLNQVAGSLFATSQPSYTGNMLVLPSGQIFYTDNSQYPELYTPTGTYEPAWAPTLDISRVPDVIEIGKDYKISGTQFNGLSQGAMYGDDVQAATNYPLVRLTNLDNGHVYYARTHDHSTMEVATGSKIVSTKFKITNTAIETGTFYNLEVVANGIPSNAKVVVVQ